METQFDLSHELNIYLLILYVFDMLVKSLNIILGIITNFFHFT